MSEDEAVTRMEGFQTAWKSTARRASECAIGSAVNLGIRFLGGAFHAVLSDCGQDTLPELDRVDELSGSSELVPHGSKFPDMSKKGS